MRKKLGAVSDKETLTEDEGKRVLMALQVLNKLSCNTWPDPNPPDWRIRVEPPESE